MAEHHYENLAERLAEFAGEAFGKLRDNEIEAAGFLRRAAVRAAYDLVHPHIPNLAQELMDYIYRDLSALTLDDLFKAMDGYRSAKGMSKP